MQRPPSFGCFPPMRMGPKYSCAGPFVSPPGSRPQGLAGKKKHSRSALVSHHASLRRYFGRPRGMKGRPATACRAAREKTCIMVLKRLPR